MTGGTYGGGGTITGGGTTTGASSGCGGTTWANKVVGLATLSVTTFAGPTFSWALRQSPGSLKTITSPRCGVPPNQ